MTITLEGCHIPGRLSLTNRSWSGGKIHAIVGPNGSGKTTLLQTLAGFCPSGQGTLRYHDREHSARHPLEMARLRSFIETSHDDPFPYPVRDVISWGRWHVNAGSLNVSDKQAIEHAAATVGIAHLLDRPVSALSTGERKKVHLARSLASEVGIYIWDEPFAPLDIASVLRIVNALKSRSDQTKTFLISVHELPLAMHIGDEVTVLSQGSVKHQGDPRSPPTKQAVEEAFGIKLQASDHYYATLMDRSQ